MKKIIFLAIILLMASPVFGGDMIVKDYQKFRNVFKDSPAIKRTIEHFINGMGEGFGWANTFLEVERNQPPLFCPPEKLALTTVNYINILDKQIQVYKETGILNPEEDYMGMIFLDGLVRTFPCDKK